MSFYRRVIRTIYRIPQEKELKRELIQYTKEEFRANMSVSDTHNRRYLLSQGKKQFKDMTRSLGLSMPHIDFEE